MARCKRIFILALLISILAFCPALAYIYTDGNAALVNSFVPGPVFTPDAAYLSLSVSKTVVSLGQKQMSPASFSFTLTNLETGSQTTLKSDENGFVSFPLTYTSANLGTHTYTLVEEKTNHLAVIFSDQVYQVEVFVYPDAASNTIKASMLLNGVDTSLAPVRNVYDPALEPPKTGVPAPVGYAILTLAASCAAFLTLRRRSSFKDFGKAWRTIDDNF